MYRRHEFGFLSSIGYIIGAELGISRLEEENANLVLELETRKLVARGKGILKPDLGMSDQEAYLALQRESEYRKRSMKDIAQAIILGPGAIDGRCVRFPLSLFSSNRTGQP